MPGLGLGRRQQGVSRFVEDIEPNPVFGLGHVPKEEDWARGVPYIEVEAL